MYGLLTLYHGLPRISFEHLICLLSSFSRKHMTKTGRAPNQQAQQDLKLPLPSTRTHQIAIDHYYLLHTLSSDVLL